MKPLLLTYDTQKTEKWEKSINQSISATFSAHDSKNRKEQKRA